MAELRARRVRGSTVMAVLALALAGAAAGCGQAQGGTAVIVAGGDATRGKAALQKYGCGSCHTIPGVDGATATVGPPLDFWSRRTYIAGEVPNTPEYLIRWIQAPQAIEPATAMPLLGVSRQDARDMAAYLYTLR